jgi:hypothetical protein
MRFASLSRPIQGRDLDLACAGDRPEVARRLSLPALVSTDTGHDGPEVRQVWRDRALLNAGRAIVTMALVLNPELVAA